MKYFGAILVLAFIFGCEGSSSDGGEVLIEVFEEIADVMDISVPPDVTADTVADTVKPDIVVEVQTETLTEVEVVSGCPLSIFSGPTCAEVASCALQCSDSSYETQCLAQGDEGAKQTYTALKECLSAASCTAPFVGEEFPACAKAACKDKLEACFVGTLRCKDIWTCRKGCDPENHGCPLACYGLATLEEQAIWVAYERCIFEVDCAQDPTNLMENGWPKTECEAFAAGHHCPNQRQACVPPT